MKSMFEVPHASVVLTGEQAHLWSHGGKPSWKRKGGSFCQWALGPDAPNPLVVEDSADARFKSSPLATSKPRIRFFAGAPLLATRSGECYGIMAVFDYKPRTFSAKQYAMLSHAAEITVREMGREQVLQAQRERLSSDIARPPAHLLRAMDGFREGVVLLDLSRPGWTVTFTNAAFCTAVGIPELLAVCGDMALTGGCQPSFWELFDEAAEGSGSYNAAINSLLGGRGFLLKVKARERDRRNSSCIVAALAAMAAARHASSDHSSSSRCSSSSESGTPGSTPAQPREQQVAAPQHQAQMLEQLRRESTTAFIPDAAALGSASEGLAGAPSLLSQSDSASQLRSIPSFYEQRPQVMNEVTLGPIIGSGAMGRCYRGMWQGGRVAVKVIDCWAGAQPSAADRADLAAAGAPSQRRQQDVPAVEAALVEALLARSLSHPHIVTTYCHGATAPRVDNIGRVHQQVWIVQEYCRGSFHDALKRGLLCTPEGAPNMHAILLSAQEIAGALHYLHQRDVIHGDLSPGNVLLASSTKDRRSWVCKLNDFGLSKCGDVSNWCKRSSILGTVTHMSPELLAEGAMTKAADVWSFGILLLEAYLGRRAWSGYSTFQVLSAITSGKMPFQIPDDAPPALASLLAGCLHTDPLQRPTFAHIMEAAQAMLEALPGPGLQYPVASSAVTAEQAAAVEAAAQAAPGPREQQQRQPLNAAADPRTVVLRCRPSIDAEPLFESPFARRASRAPVPSPAYPIGVSVREPSLPASPFTAAAAASAAQQGVPVYRFQSAM
ncbi:hypothetical protein CHLNCDRAFT_138454 [Chlorella variabilis]|uniref:Protein kinase domain-containing protein n=1 Tax=Chlorella variabilis TaxID=554065 RepID=E1ZN33_CHLVA|nr:hypothetical protein CHLNCDRAFT_138454 [Chlorella variabilis]EFN52801.1 hypothetical protein CHLNCDRAFT_138454 [Chlorella variabilis]|eukprot:XP_005844903.1 hypothetical protein CHLNCDRAFT_138454 [Chlorella variabilis]